MKFSGAACRTNEASRKHNAVPDRLQGVLGKLWEKDREREVPRVFLAFGRNLEGLNSMASSSFCMQIEVRGSRLLFRGLVFLSLVSCGPEFHARTSCPEAPPFPHTSHTNTLPLERRQRLLPVTATGSSFLILCPHGDWLLSNRGSCRSLRWHL